LGDICLAISDSIAVVTIDRPPVNALRTQTYTELDQTFSALAQNNEVKCVIITGAGKKAFAAGADVNDFLALDSNTGAEYTRRNTQIRENIRNFPAPVICAINGLALGGGFVLALMCDIRVSSEEARLNLSEINMGIIGGTQHIAPYVSPGTAKIMVYTGDMITAQQALQLGLVDIVVPGPDLLGHCWAIARKIVSKPPLAIRYAKQSLNFAYSGGLSQGIEVETKYIEKLWGTRDKNEAVAAFLEKRTPVFKGV